MTHPNRYIDAFNGSFTAMLRWPQLETLWHTLRDQTDSWWIYQPPHPLPTAPLQGAELAHFIEQLDAQLRRDHAYDYCGIVYVDDPHSPSFIKIYDPNNLGVVCGISQGKPLPGWILSKIPPQPLADTNTDAQKSHWWQGIFTKTP
ncbi:MAG: hypothetical protein OEW58_12175 [Gammaproteobacteria bacterium]|nr:hypothetical protein [Gammaproteobacteria bacterium]